MRVENRQKLLERRRLQAGRWMLKGLSKAEVAPCASKPHRSQHGAPLMYRKHFPFTRFPFETELDPDELFAFSALSEAQARNIGPDFDSCCVHG